MNNKLIYGVLGLGILTVLVVGVLPAFNAAIDRVYNQGQTAVIYVPVTTVTAVSSRRAVNTEPTTSPAFPVLTFPNSSILPVTDLDGGLGSTTSPTDGMSGIIRTLFGGGAGQPGQQIYFQFNLPMYYGVRTLNVAILQLFLNTHGYFVTSHLTTFFGKLTSAALARYQKAHGLKASGEFDAVTQAFVNAQIKNGFFPMATQTP